MNQTHPPALPSFSGAAIVLDDTFDRPDSPAVGEGWVESEQSGTAVAIAANKLFFATTSDAANRPLASRSFSPVVTGTLQWDFDFDWARTGNEGTYRFLMQLGDGAAMSPASQNAGAGVNLVWTSIDGTHQSLGYRKSGVNTALSVLSGPGSITVVADLDAQTYSVAVDGTIVGSGLPFDANVSLDTVRYFTDSLNESNFSGRTIDNLSLFSSDSLPPVNAPPVASDQSVGTVENTPRSVILTATDPVDCQLVFTIVVGPAHGALGALADHPCVSGSPNSDSATLVYTPDAGFTGSDSFTWQADDGLELSEVAGVAIEVALQPAFLISDTFDRPDSPAVGEGWIESEQAGTAVAIAANKLFFATTSDAVNRPLASRSFSPVATGTLQWDFDFDWARTGNEGTYRFLMQLGDGAAMSPASQNAGAGVNLVWTSIDGTHQSLGFRKSGVNTALAVLSGPGSITVVADLDARTYSVAVDGAVVGSNLPFDANVPLDTVRFFTDSLSESNFSGRTIDNLNVSSSDSLPPVNAPPEAPDQSLGTVEDTPLSVILAAADPVDCQLVFTIVVGPAHGTLGALADHPCVSGSPNSDSATVLYTPDAGFTGSDSFSWQANDGLELSDVANVAINVASQPAFLVSDTFDRPNSPIVGEGWVESEQAGTAVAIAANKLFFATTSDAANRPLASRSFSPVATGTLQWGFDFDWTRTGAEGTYRFLMQLGDGAAMSPASQNAGAGVNLVWTSINGTHQSLGYRKSGVDTALAVLSGPGSITVLANQDARTYSVAVNGAVVGSGLPFDATVSLDTVRFFTDSLNESNFSGRTIDNLSISLEPETNSPPVANAGPDQEVPVGATVDLFGNGSTDADGDSLTYSWNLLSMPAGSTASLTGSATAGPSFVADLLGSYLMELVVNDGIADSAPDTVAVDAINVAPVAQDDYYAMFQDTILTIGPIDGVLANDEDANGDPLITVLTTGPTSGSLTFNGDGSFDYTPPAGFLGSAEFTYVADDGSLISNTATVSIEVSVDTGEPGPLNLQPISGQTGVSVNPTLEIDCLVPDTISAQYQIATGPAFTTVVYDSGENINDVCHHLAFAELDASTSYHWRGRIKNTEGEWSPYSLPTSFATVDGSAIFTNVFQDGFEGYDGAIDADIRGSAVDPTQVIRQWNQGAQDVLRTGRRLPNQPTDEIYRTLLQFDISGRLADPEAVINAYIELTGWHHTDSNHLFHAYNSMYELNKPWGEGAGVEGDNTAAGEVSWTYTARPEEWAIPGAASASDTDPDADRSETALVQMVATNHEGDKSYWSSKNLVDAVKGWIDEPASNYGVLIKAFDETSQQTLHQASRENPDLDFRPKLVIMSTEELQAPENVAPVALDQSVSSEENLSLDLLLDYTDPDGPGPHTFSIVTPPSHGGLTGSGADRSYAPDLDFVGSDYFTWQVNDGQEDSNEAVVCINISQSIALFSDNFDCPDSSVVGQGWVEVERSVSPLATVSIADNKLYFDDTSDASNRPLTKRSFSPVSTGKIQWDFDFDWARTSADTGYEFWMQLGDSEAMSDDNQSSGVGVNLRWGGFNSVDQSLVARQDATKGGPTALTTISGPTHVSVTANLPARTYSVTVNDILVGSGLSFDQLGTVSKLDTVRFFTNNLNEQNFTGRTIDNLIVFIPVNTPPVADAGPDQEDVSVGSTVVLDGSSSSDPDPDTLTYNWIFTSVPDGSTVSLTGSATSAPSFVPDLEGVYEAELVVNDGFEDSLPDSMTVTAVPVNTPPVADAGPDQEDVSVGSTVVLDGSSSSDPDPDTLTYNWIFTSVPDGSTVSLTGSATSAPSFVPDLEGVYEAELVVNDGFEDSLPDSMTVTAVPVNAPPVANAGPDQEDVSVGSTVVLDGSNSSDADGDPLNYSWIFTSVPDGSTASLTGSATSNSSFVPDLEGAYGAELVINDGSVDSLPDSVTITAQ